MYEITDSAHPQHVFLLFEDSASPTRAELQAVPQQSGEHSRWHSHVVSAEFHTLLRHANLPGPLGSPAGTPGPGAWVQRGAQILFDGMSFRIRLGRRTLDAKNEQPECLLNIGNVVIGADRIVGGIVEVCLRACPTLTPDPVPPTHAPAARLDAAGLPAGGTAARRRGPAAGACTCATNALVPKHRAAHDDDARAAGRNRARLDVCLAPGQRA